jgi:hypothetical protein
VSQRATSASTAACASTEIAIDRPVTPSSVAC